MTATLIFIQMIILDLFYDLLHLDIPSVCDSYEETMKSLCNRLFFSQESFMLSHKFSSVPVWNLTTVEEGYTYVATEGANKLSRLSYTRLQKSIFSLK